MVAILTGLREPPPEWEVRLREVDPKRDAVSYLAFVWYEPAERWVLYEMVPRYATPQQILDELKGFDPETIPETCPLISRRQWLLYQKYERWARPCWVLQGSKGGHQVAYDAADTELLRRTGRPSEPPALGSLPPAPFDERAVKAIMQMNKLHLAKNDLDEFRRVNTGEGAKRLYRDRMKGARAAQIAYLDAQFEDAAQDFGDALSKGELDDAPVSETDWHRKDEEASRNFIETGSPSLAPE